MSYYIGRSVCLGVLLGKYIFYIVANIWKGTSGKEGRMDILQTIPSVTNFLAWIISC